MTAGEGAGTAAATVGAAALPDAVRGRPFSWRFVAPLYMGATLNPVNSSIIATALVQIARSVHVPVGRTAVLISALYLACAIAQATAGKLGEELGPRRVFVGGILIVLAGGLLGGFASDLTTLIVARVLIGVGTSAGYPSAMLIIRRRASEAGLAGPPGPVLGGLMVTSTVTLAAGLPIGGLLVEAWGWRSAFFANVPFSLVAVIMVLVWQPPDPPVRRDSARDIATRLDVAGMVGFGGVIAALLVFLLSFPRPQWAALGIGVVLAAALVVWELRAAKPFLDLRLLARNRPLTLTYVRWALGMLCAYSLLYGLAQWLEAGRGASAEETGLLLVPMSVVSAVALWAFSGRNLVRTPLLVSVLVFMAGSGGVLLLDVRTPVAWIVVITMVFGVSMGATASGNQTTLYASTPPELMGTASGMFRTWGYVGSIASSALIALAFRRSVDDHGLHVIALVMLAVSGLGLAVTLVDRTAMRRSVTVAPPVVSGAARGQRALSETSQDS